MSDGHYDGDPDGPKNRTRTDVCEHGKGEGEPCGTCISDLLGNQKFREHVMDGKRTHYENCTSVLNFGHVCDCPATSDRDALQASLRIADAAIAAALSEQAALQAEYADVEAEAQAWKDKVRFVEANLAIVERERDAIQRQVEQVAQEKKTAEYRQGVEVRENSRLKEELASLREQKDTACIMLIDKIERIADLQRTIADVGYRETNSGYIRCNGCSDYVVTPAGCEEIDIPHAPDARCGVREGCEMSLRPIWRRHPFIAMVVLSGCFPFRLLLWMLKGAYERAVELIVIHHNEQKEIEYYLLGKVPDDQRRT